MADTTYYANPYSIDHTGFYFHDLAEFEAGLQALKARGAEEVEIDYIDGDDAELFRAAGINQATIGEWFELLDELEPYHEPALFYLLDVIGEPLNDALSHVEDVYVFEGTPEEYAENYVEDAGLLEGLPEHLRYYWDVKAFADDMVLNGDIHELSYAGSTYTVSCC